VLAITNHRVPRWFTEGMAVYEETAAAPDWGDRLDPPALAAIKNKKLLPVAELDRGFIRPSYPDQVVVSYFQAGKICSYIAEKWGYSKLLEMIHSFGELKTTPEVIQQDLGMKPEEFDTQFLAWLTAQTKTTVDGFKNWQETLRKMHRELAAKEYDAAIADGKAIRDVYPDYVEAASVYEALAKAYLAKGDKPAAIAQLETYSKAAGRSPETLKHLASLQAEQGRKKEAAATLARLLFIYPLDEDLHRRLGELWLGLGNTKGAIGEYRAVLAMKPLDQAGAHFELAKALRAAQRDDEAKNEVISALETAPGFKPAQRLLLELDSGNKKID
jgi:tetratricopeptide (TPR) repeat protein